MMIFVKPCYHLKNSVCSDYFSADGVDINKNEYNEKLDIRLMKLLNLKFDEIYEFKDIIELFNSEVSLKTDKILHGIVRIKMIIK